MLSSLLNPKRIDGSSSFYYGWIIVAVALISMAFWLGIRSSFSVFYVALLEEFPWNRGSSAGVQSMALLTYTILAPLVGGLIDRFGPRRVVVPGILLLALGLVLCSTVDTLTQFYLLYGVVMGSGITCIGIVTYSAILAHWFEKKTGSGQWNCRFRNGTRNLFFGSSFPELYFHVGLADDFYCHRCVGAHHIIAGQRAFSQAQTRRRRTMRRRAQG
jgi:MFS family permease